MPRAEGRAAPHRAARGRAGLRQEPPSARVRQPGRKRRGARALRRLRRGGAHALRAFRRGARTPRARHRAGGAARRARRRAAASWPGCCPILPAQVGELPTPVEADPDTERHRLHTAVADLLANVGRGSRSCSCSRTGIGRTRRRCCSCATWRAPRWSARAADPRDLPRHRGRGAGGALRDACRPAPLRRRRAAASGGALAGRRSLISSVAPPEATPDARATRARARTIRDLTGGNAFLVCELWRALLETGDRRGRVRRRSG